MGHGQGGPTDPAPRAEWPDKPAWKRVLLAVLNLIGVTAGGGTPLTGDEWFWTETKHQMRGAFTKAKKPEANDEREV